MAAGAHGVDEETSLAVVIPPSRPKPVRKVKKRSRVVRRSHGEKREGVACEKRAETGRSAANGRLHERCGQPEPDGGDHVCHGDRLGRDPQALDTRDGRRDQDHDEDDHEDAFEPAEPGEGDRRG